MSVASSNGDNGSVSGGDTDSEAESGNVSDCGSIRSTASATGGSNAASSASTPSTTTGAMLFSVVGGKMSEGINFSDDLARAVVVVGLPFPNPSDLELKERLTYLDSRAGSANGGGSGGKEYYENLCMRAVNQSIGRSIRHARDHAVIVLLDHRYATPRIKSKLPGWIADRVTDHAVWNTVAATVGAFFRHKREQQQQLQQGAAASASGHGAAVAASTTAVARPFGARPASSTEGSSSNAPTDGRSSSFKPLQPNNGSAFRPLPR
jgi:hypothetical protein